MFLEEFFHLQSFGVKARRQNEQRSNVKVCVSHLVSVDGVLLLQLALPQRLVLLLKLLQLFGWNLEAKE